MPPSKVLDEADDIDITEVDALSVMPVEVDISHAVPLPVMFQVLVPKLRVLVFVFAEENVPMV